MSTRRTRRAPRCASAQRGSIPPLADDDAEWSDLVVEGLDLSGIVAATLTITGCVLRDVSLTGASIGELRIDALQISDIARTLFEGLDIVVLDDTT